jgi:hypothetical protein
LRLTAPSFCPENKFLQISLTHRWRFLQCVEKMLSNPLIHTETASLELFFNEKKTIERREN